MEPSPIRQTDPQETRLHRRQFGQGVAWGCLPVILTWIVPGFIYITKPTGSYADLGAALTMLIVAALVYLVELIFTIALLVSREQRFIGYGLLALILVGPVISYVGCVVVPQYLPR